MKFEFSNQKLDSLFAISNNIQNDEEGFQNFSGINRLLWNRNSEPVSLNIDSINIDLQPNQLVTVTGFHKLIYLEKKKPLHAILFNRPFYCLIDHDAEVGCNGILFYGTQDIPIITLAEKEQLKTELLWQVLIDEFDTKDSIQGEMLQMLLKRFIIICTRLAKEQLIVKDLKDAQIDIVRQFNFLVDMHFREKKLVKDYADLLFKSPKTLSNLFSIYNQKSPQLIIQERVVLEAKRLLHFTEKQTQEIAYELGFEDPAHFSRFFKKVALLSPTEYRDKKVLLS